MKKKILLSCFVIIGFILIAFINGKVNAASVSETEINLYAVKSTMLEEFPELEIPSNFPQEYTVKVKDTTTAIKDMYFYVRRESDDQVLNPYNWHIDIDKETGTIKPKVKETIDSDTNEVIETSYYFGDSQILCINVDNTELRIKVNIVDYSTTYVDNKLQEYVDNNLKNMTDLEKAKAITKYVAENFDYSTKYQSYKDMYLRQCGDCWASTNIINKICELARLKSHTRNAKRDAGSGSGHENNAILVDGKVYLGDAGFVGTRPRTYEFFEEDPPYTCKLNADGTFTLLQYDGFETETLVVPSTINGRTVTTIGSYFYGSNTIRPKKIVLPDTITTIEHLAFYPGVSGDSLENINIPKSVTSIEYGAFSNCEYVRIDGKENSNFVIENDIIYNKEKTKIIEALSSYNGDKTYIMPNTVTEISKNSFFAVEGIENVVISPNLTIIPKEGFYGGEIKNILIPKTVQEIGEAGFASCDKLISVEFEEGSTCKIGDNAFANCYLITTAKIPKTITSIGTKIFRNNFGYLTIYGEKDSVVQAYAEENDYKFSAGNVEIQNKFIVMEKESIEYEADKDMKPKFTVSYLGKELTEGKDYTVTYDEDYEKVGEHEFTVKGIGNFAGEVTKTYRVIAGESVFNVTCEDIMEGEEFNPKIYNPYNQTYICYITNSSGYTFSNLASATAPGEYEFYYQAYSDDYYKGKTIRFKATIKSASIPLESIERAKGEQFNWAYVGDKLQFAIKYNPSNTTIVKNLKWTSSNENVATIDEEGNVTILEKGYTYIYAKVAGKSLSFRIQVNENTRPLESISITGAESQMTIGETKKIGIQMNPTDATCRSDKIWESSDSSILSIDEDGTIEALKEGTAIIKVTLGEKTAISKITVVKEKEEELKLGDVNEDGKINARDAKMALQYYTKKIELTEKQQKNADVNQDNKINARDAKLILQYYTKKITEFKV